MLGDEDISEEKRGKVAEEIEAERREKRRRE
jgi:hypothetical protein